MLQLPFTFVGCVMRPPVSSLYWVRLSMAFSVFWKLRRATKLCIVVDR